MKEKINNLAIEWVNMREETVFNELYRLLESTVWSRTLSRDARFTNSTENDVQSIYHETLWKVIQVYDPKVGPFINVLNVSTRNAIKNLVKSSKLRYWLEMYAEETEENSAATLENFRDERMNVEDDALKKQKKRDQRQLISILVNAVNDDLTSEIVRLIDPDISYHALGKALGIRNETVKAKIERLARHFDANLLGKPTDYFAV